MDLRQSTAGQVVTIGHALDSTNGNDEENGLTIANTDIKLHKHNTTVLADKNSGGATNISNGVYHLTFDATDSSIAGRLVAYVHVAGALPMKEEFNVLTQSAFDAKYTGTFNNLGGVAQTADNDILLQLTATATAQTTAQSDLDTITGSDGVTLATAQALYAPSKAGDSMNISSINNNAITALSIATSALDGKGNWNVGKTGYALTVQDWNTVTPPTTAQIWAETTRVLTSGANIVLAKGIGVTGFNDITAASVLAAGDIDGFSLEEAQKLTLSMGVGVLSGAATSTITIQAADGSKARITATVDADGNRSAVVKDVTG